MFFYMMDTFSKTITLKIFKKSLEKNPKCFDFLSIENDILEKMIVSVCDNWPKIVEKIAKNTEKKENYKIKYKFNHPFYERKIKQILNHPNNKYLLGKFYIINIIINDANYIYPLTKKVFEKYVRSIVKTKFSLKVEKEIRDYCKKHMANCKKIRLPMAKRIGKNMHKDVVEWYNSKKSIKDFIINNFNRDLF